jgi:uncharacterized protein YdbL (DUF1318 family)
MNYAKTILAGIVLYLTLIASIQAQDLPSIKKAMKERLPAITSMKSSGALGENNKGFLEIRGGLSDEQKKIVNNENHDRKIVYKAIAGKLNQSPELVGKKRAKQIYETTPSGVWVQKQNGEWIKK